MRPFSEVPDERRRPRESVGSAPAPRQTNHSTCCPNATYLNGPRCGLSRSRSSHRLAIMHCRRCAGGSRTHVASFGSGSPADLLYAERALPPTTAVPAAPRHQHRGRVIKAPTTTPTSVELVRSATPGGRQ